MWRLFRFEGSHDFALIQWQWIRIVSHLFLDSHVVKITAGRCEEKPMQNNEEKKNTTIKSHVFHIIQAQLKYRKFPFFGEKSLKCFRVGRLLGNFVRNGSFSSSNIYTAYVKSWWSHGSCCRGNEFVWWLDDVGIKLDWWPSVCCDVAVFRPLLDSSFIDRRIVSSANWSLLNQTFIKLDFQYLNYYFNPS